MDVPRTVYAQGGRVLIACDASAKDNSGPHHISFWDTVDGTIAQQLQVPAGLPRNFGVSPNGLYFLAMLDDSDGPKLGGWRLDGEDRAKDNSSACPAAVVPR